MSIAAAAAEEIARHEAAGRYFDAGGVRSFVRESGKGTPVVCIHGVPASCYLYRKMITELAALGLRGVAFDLPGLGLAERPANFDYTWTGLARFCASAVDALALDRFHLVVHDIGGPIGFELARAMPHRIRSLTILDTILDPANFSRPWTMAPFAIKGVGLVWLRSLNHLVYRELFYREGIHDRRAMTHAEVAAYLELLLRGDRGEAFLKIMRGFELTEDMSTRIASVVRDVPYPVQLVWAANDRALTPSKAGKVASRVTGLELQLIPGGHFFQEEQPAAIAQRIAIIDQVPATGAR